jgi:lysophospholipase L1-like esterase
MKNKLRAGMFCMGPYAFLGVTKKYLEFKKKYAHHPAGEIVYYGASNFTFWDTCEEDMKPYHVQNHGFGGCTDALMLKYADNLLYPYKPSVVFIQTGSNDNATGLTLEEIKQNKKTLFKEYRKHLPDTIFIIMSGLPLPGRAKYWQDINDTNSFLKEYCTQEDHLEFIDATDVMTTENGDFRPEFFNQDGIHLNRDGHNAWTTLMKAKLAELGIGA